MARIWPKHDHNVVLIIQYYMVLEKLACQCLPECLAGLPAGGSKKTNKRLGKPGLHSADLDGVGNGTMPIPNVLAASLLKLLLVYP